MRACGIVAEYNPFHNGHLWQLNQAKEKSGADVIVVVMSGNFLQRGEPAFIDKWNRAAMALAGGADLIVELPFAFAVQPADLFARGAVSILHALNCSGISFGVENGSDTEYEQAGTWYHDHESLINEAMKKAKNDGASYPVQMAQAMQALEQPFSFDLSSPNNQLGFAYARENALYASPMNIHTVKRKGSGYHDTALQQGTIASATAIRQSLIGLDKREGLETAAPFVPSATLERLADNLFVDWEHFWPLLKYQLIVQPVEELRKVYQMIEGIEHRLKEAAAKSGSFREFLTTVKTKRYTWTRLQRLAVYTLLQVTDEQMKERMQEVQAVRVLGFSAQGRRYLNQEKHRLTVPLITNVNRKNAALVGQETLTGEIYRLADSESIERQDFTRAPIRRT